MSRGRRAPSPRMIMLSPLRHGMSMNCVADPRDCPQPCRAEEAAAGVEPQTLAPVLARPDLMNGS